MAAIQKAELCSPYVLRLLSLPSPSATQVCLEALDPPEMFQFYDGTFPGECIGMMTVVRFWVGCFAVIFSRRFVPMRLQCPPSWGPDIQGAAFQYWGDPGEVWC